MRVAGRKNDGAWFRTNEVIRKLNNGEKEALAGLIVALPEIESFYQVIEVFNAIAALPGNDIVSSTQELAHQYAYSGIPRQAWMGKLSYDTYTKVGGKWKPVHQHTAHEFGKAIRKLMKSFVFARRQAKDLGNVGSRAEGNPGGIADANDNT